MYSTQTIKFNVKRSAILCIPVRSPVACVNLFLHYMTLGLAPPNISIERQYVSKVI